MNKQELIAVIAEKAELTKKDAAKALEAFQEAVTQVMVDGDKLTLVGFGTFGTKERAARDGVNPRTKAKLRIPASTVPFFKYGKALKDAVNA